MKQTRHEAILNLINLHEVETQEELASLLTKEGYSVTQATVSRDIKALRLVKTIGSEGRYRYVRADDKKDDDDIRSIITQSTVSVNYAQNIVVIKTHSGMAQAAAAIIDSLKLAEIVGTIAGDDTIMCVAKTEQEALRLTARIKAMT